MRVGNAENLVEEWVNGLRTFEWNWELRIDKSRIPKLGENIFRAAVDIRTEQCYEMEIRGEKIDEYQQKCCFMTWQAYFSLSNIVIWLNEVRKKLAGKEK